MRKITLMAVATLLATVANAQRPYGNIDDVDSHPYLKTRVAKDAGNLKLPQQGFTAQKARKINTDDMEPIFDQPEGELMLMRRSGTDYLPVYGSPSPADYTEKGTYVVKGTDGCYYFKNIVTNMCNGGTWVKGVEDDGIIEIQVGQISCELVYYGMLYSYVLFAMKEVEATGTDWNGEEYTYTTYDIDWDQDKIMLRIEDDGSITSVDDKLMIGAVQSDDLVWPGYGDVNSTFYPFDGTPQTMPDDANVQDFVLSYPPYLSDMKHVLAQGAFSGDKFYLTNFSEHYPEAVLALDMQGEKAVLNTDQFVGVDPQYSTLDYIKACSYYVEEDEWGWQTIYTDAKDNIEFTYDADAKRFVNNTEGFVLNAGSKSISSHETYLLPTIYYFEEKPAVPANPKWNYFSNFDEQWGWGYAGFSIFTTDTEGNYIKPEKMSYVVYSDDEVVTFNQEMIPDMPFDELTEIPFDYSCYDIVVSGDYRVIYFYVDIFPGRIGVQVIYTGGGEERRSDIVYFEDPDGIAKVGDNAQVQHVTYYDLSGRTVESPAKGMYVQRLIMTDGTTRTAKVLIR